MVGGLSLITLTSLSGYEIQPATTDHAGLDGGKEKKKWLTFPHNIKGIFIPWMALSAVGSFPVGTDHLFFYVKVFSFLFFFGSCLSPTRFLFSSEERFCLSFFWTVLFVCFLFLFICSALFPVFSRVKGENMLLKGHRDGYWTNKSLCLKVSVTFCP